MPRRFFTSGRKFSTTTSARATSFWRSSRPRGCFRSSVSARLVRWRFRKSKPSAVESPSISSRASTLMTLAPMSARRRTAVGPERARVRSTTVRCSSGRGIDGPPESLPGKIRLEDGERLRPARQLRRHGIADLLADQGARERGQDRAAAAGRVGLVGADHLVADFLAGLVPEQDGGSEGDAVAGGRRRDDLRAAHLRLELRDAALDEALLLPRRVVLRILGEVAVRARLGDRLRDRVALDALQVLELVLELLVARTGHRRPRNRHDPSNLTRGARASGSEDLPAIHPTRGRIRLETSTFEPARAPASHDSHAWLCFCASTSLVNFSRSAWNPLMSAPACSSTFST